MTGSNTPLEEQAEHPDVIAQIQIALSADLYARAMNICQRRNCTLEAVVEELIERFLPGPRPKIKKTLEANLPPDGADARQGIDGKKGWFVNAKDRQRQFRR